MNLLKYLRSNQFAIIIAILSVLVQSFHSFTAFYNTSSLQNGWGIAQSILFSIVIDMAIIFYTVRGRRDIAMYAAVAMVTINAYYYYQHLGVTFEFIFGCFLSLIIPISVYFYSEEIKDADDPDNDKEIISDLRFINEGLRSAMDISETTRLETLKERDRFEQEAITLKKRHKEILDGNTELSRKLDDEIANNVILRRDLEYIQRKMNTVGEELNTAEKALEELIPDPIEEEHKPEHKITRTGGQKL